jgi:NAD(P)-dependent dehydrogenase (short-subunit alcohol dehydrogenase family)/acyl carrier protein
MMTNVEIEAQRVFAEVTRYPLDILDLQADLEDDLGIDSVKLGEVFAVLRDKYRLPEKLEIPREELRTIGHIAKALKNYLPLVAPASPPEMPKAVSPNGHRDNGAAAAVAMAPESVPVPGENELVERVLNVFAEVTRYPREILDPAASLEDDLGIDSVKLGEVFSVLREQYGLPAKMDIPRESLTDINGIALALRTYLSGIQTAPAIPNNSTLDLPEPGPSHLQEAEIESVLIDVFAEVTRYPREILDPAADLEDDLGIDSVKLGEAFSVLRERYNIKEAPDIPKESLRTLRGIAAGLVTTLSVQSPSGAGPKPMAESTNGNGFASQSPAIEQSTPAAKTVESAAAALYSLASRDLKPFAGKVAFVSGSGRGLGRDVSIYLAQLGASVIINSFHSRPKGEETAEEIRNSGGDAIHVWGSMANPQHVGRVFDEIEEHYGFLDFFVGNASNGMLARLEDITVEHWEKAYRTNVIGLHQSALRAVKLMRRRGGGKIITMSSPAAHGYVDYFGCMGTVKAAVESLTRSMAIEFASYNIQVNCVSPGPVYGELLTKWPDSERLIRQWEGNTAYGRLCEARDVSHFIAYLLSEPVKLFTGSVLVLDGGISSQGW